ncbi:MAG TPA: hypothetical protein VFK61_02235 [Candidatus Limnocylindria bacterium]|nr:hypothetical protein [Candidatus Limnocylindria bacterium]
MPKRAARVTLACFVVLLAACVAAPSVTESPAGSAQPSEASPSTEGTSSPPASPPAWNHPAEGLAVVRFPDPASPVSHVFVIGADGQAQQVTGVSRESTGADYPRWSPDRSQLAVGPAKIGATRNEIVIANADGSDERVITEGLKAWWSPGGTRLLVESWDYVRDLPVPLRVVNLARQREREIADGFNGQWLDEGTIGLQQDTSVFMVSTGGEARELPQLAGAEPHWSPDGSSLLFVLEGTIYLADADGSGARALVDGFAPVWSPDGTRFAFGAGMNEEAIPLLAVADLDGNVHWSGVPGSDVTWSPDGTRLAAGVPIPDTTVRVVDASSGQVLWEEAGMHPAWS